jgi:hypothetical protein
MPCSELPRHSPTPSPFSQVLQSYSGKQRLYGNRWHRTVNGVSSATCLVLFLTKLSEKCGLQP